MRSCNASAWANLPPLEAIENEDWGRDWLQAHFESLPAATLAALAA